MNAAFDPYHRWLGIPPQDQPAHHYRLLGLALFESNLEVIANAADRQMAHVQSFKTGPQSELSQKLLNEISAAKLCLLNPQQRSNYDAALRQKLAGPALPAASPVLPAAGFPVAAVPVAAVPVAAVPVAKPVQPAAPRTIPLAAAPAPPRVETPVFDFGTTRTPQRRKKSAVPQLVATGIVVLILVCVGAFLWSSNSGKRLQGLAQGTSQATSSTTEGTNEPAYVVPVIATGTAPLIVPPLEPVPTVEPVPSAEPVPPAEPTATAVPGEPRRPEPTPAPAVPRVDHEVVQTIDLLPRVVPARDMTVPGWIREGTDLFRPRGPTAGFHIPCTVPLEYRLKFEINREVTGNNAFVAFTILAGPTHRQSTVYVALYHNNQRHAFIDQVDGKHVEGNPSKLIDNFFTEGVWHEVTCTVRQHQIEVAVDGRKVIHWDQGLERIGRVRGDILTAFPNLRRDSLALWGGDNAYRIRKLVLEELAPQPRLPVPSPQVLEQAQKIFAETLDPQIKAARTYGARYQELKNALKAAAETDDSVASRYQLYRTIRERAVSAGIPSLALSTLEVLDRYEGPDALANRVAVFREAALQIAEEERAFHAVSALETIPRAVQMQRYAEAEALLNTAKDVARKAPVPHYFNDACAAWTERLKVLQASAQSVAPLLAQTNLEPAAALAVGRYHVQREEFDLALPLLAQSSGDWKSTAVADLANPSEPQAMFDLAESWRRLATGANGVERAALLHRASVWYQASLPSLTSLRKAAATKALDEIGHYSLTRGLRDQTVVYRGKRLLCCNISMTWEQADEWTRARGGRLGCIRDGAENDQFLRLMVEAHKTDRGDVHLGLRRVGPQRKWQWSDGSKFQYTHWRDSQPDDYEGKEEVAQIQFNSDQAGGWNDNALSRRYWFFAQWPAE